MIDSQIEDLSRIKQSILEGMKIPSSTIECHGLDTPEQVFFYEQDYYCLSNFSSFTVVWRKIRFDTLEHAYHWEKFYYEVSKEDPTRSTYGAILDGAKLTDLRLVQEMIRTASSAHEAFIIGQRYKSLRRPDWDEVVGVEGGSSLPVKEHVMLDLMRCKTTQHEYVRRKLLATNDRELIENSWRDGYWGWGEDRKGLNRAGKCWMIVRNEQAKLTM